MLLFFILISLAVIMFFVIRAQRKPEDDVVEYPSTSTPPIPEKLLSLKDTTVAERQRAYHRSFQKQQLYDVLQSQAEEAGDTAILEAIRTNTYKGRLPVYRPDGTYTHYTSKIYEFEIAGMMYRDMKKVIKCKGVADARLIAEPTNEFDPDAIKVIHESNTHVGYIPRTDTALVRSIVTLPADCFVYIFCNDDNTDAHGTVYIEIKKQ